MDGHPSIPTVADQIDKEDVGQEEKEEVQDDTVECEPKDDARMARKQTSVASSKTQQKVVECCSDPTRLLPHHEQIDQVTKTKHATNLRGADHHDAKGQTHSVPVAANSRAEVEFLPLADIQAMPTASPPRQSLPGAYAQGSALPYHLRPASWLPAGRNNEMTDASQSDRTNTALMSGSSSSNNNTTSSDLTTLVRARLVAAPEEDQMQATEFPQAVQVPTEPESRGKSTASVPDRRWRRNAFLGLALVVAAVVVGVSLGVHFDGKATIDNREHLRGSGGEDSAPTDTTSTLSPRDHILSLLPSYTLHSILIDSEVDSQEREQTSQTKALEWMLKDPNLGNYTEERILQRFSLASLYYATFGDDWVNNTHWLDYHTHECMWHVLSFAEYTAWRLQMEQEGVTFSPMEEYAHDTPCNSQGVYEHLWLKTNNLQGTSPPELYLLTSLRTLYLAFNQDFTLSFHDDPYNSHDQQLQSMSHPPNHHQQPALLGKLSNLELLNLGPGQELNEKLPTELGLLNKLKLMAIFGKQALGPLPTEVGSLTQLTFLGVGGTLTGNIPSQLGNLERLRALYLKANSLTGSIPMEVWNLGKKSEIPFVMLDVRNNTRLSGTIPTDACQAIPVLLHDCTEQMCGCNCNCSVST